MVFSSPVFLFLFLPVVLLLYFGVPRQLRNLVLLVSSLFFYAWGEVHIVAVMVLSILANWMFGRRIERARGEGGGRGAVAAAVGFNLGLLVLFKYANWLWANLSALCVELGWSAEGWPPIGYVIGPALEALGLVDEPLSSRWQIRLPIGISFFTFQAISYIVDVYRGDGKAQKNPIHFGVYLALFPQLIAGPIIRYRDVAEQILVRVVTLDGFAWGVRRFIIGLAKKMLIANQVGALADEVFAIPGPVNAPVAWLGVLAYTLQIYFDFSGYSDMAIGLGRMFGFRFLENFNFPYISRSITEFWRRWHISLSSWYRDYLYIPLGGNRKGAGRTYFNLVLVFFLCGLWHGASWSFVVWGLYHGLFLVVERMGVGRLLDRAGPIVRHVYTLLVVMIGWVFFRAESFERALELIAAMFGGSTLTIATHTVALHLNPVRDLAILAGVIGSIPCLPRLLRWRDALADRKSRVAVALDILGQAALFVLLLASAMELAAGTYNPFIYYRF